jgi:hypothetical protein
MERRRARATIKFSTSTNHSALILLAALETSNMFINISAQQVETTATISHRLLVLAAKCVNDLLGTIPRLSVLMGRAEFNQGRHSMRMLCYWWEGLGRSFANDCFDRQGACGDNGAVCDHSGVGVCWRMQEGRRGQCANSYCRILTKPASLPRLPTAKRKIACVAIAFS